MFTRKRRRRSASEATPFDLNLSHLLLAALLVVTPVLRGGNRQIALVVVLGLGLALLAVLATRWTLQRFHSTTPAPSDSTTPALQGWHGALLLALATSPQWIALLQLVPIPTGWWGQLGGRQPYLDAMAASGIPLPPSLPLSLTPQATWASLWASIPITAVFLAAVTLTERHIYPLIKLLLLLGLCQAVLAVAQFATGGASSPLNFGGGNGGTVIGSFANRNSLADYLAMMLPLWFVVLLHLDRQGHSKHHGDGGPFQGLFKPLWVGCGFVLLVVLVSTQSRGGLLASLVALALSLWVYLGTHKRQELSAKARWGMAIGGVLFAAAALLAAGADKVTTRIQRQQVVVDVDTRATYARSTFEAGQTLWPWGSGMGSFESVFPRFQHLHSLGFVNEAHNDYAQLFMELGFWSVLVVLTVGVLVLRQMVRLYTTQKADGRLSTTVATQWLAGCAALVLLLHSWVDFNMRIPALALTAAMLAGFFLRPPSAHADGRGSHRRRSD